MTSNAEDATAAENTVKSNDNESFAIKTELIDLTIIDDSESNTETKKMDGPSKNGDDVNESGKASLDAKEQDKANIQVKIERESPEKRNQVIEHDSLILTADDEIFSVVSNGKDSPQKSQKTSSNDRKLKRESSNASHKTERDDKIKQEQRKLPNKSESSCKSAYRSIWVMNVSKYSKASDLKQYFTKCGKVSTAKIVTDGTNFYGFLSFETREDAEKSIKKLDGTTFDNRKLKLSFTKPNLQSRDNSAEKRGKSTSERKSKRKSHEHDPLTTRFTAVKSRKKSRSPSYREKQLERDFLREKREIERLKRRIQEQEEQFRLERSRQRQREDKQREFEWKLEMQKKQLEMEKEMFEKERKELLRLEEVRRKIEEERLEILKERARVEAKVKDTLRSVRKSDSKQRSEAEKDDDKRRKTSVKSKICDTSYSKSKMAEEHYSYHKEPKDMIDFPRIAPPPPKLSETPKSKMNRSYEASSHRRDEDVKKSERDYRKIETIHRDRRADSDGRRERFMPRVQGNGGLNQQEAWKQPFASKSWDVGQHVSSGRYEPNYPAATGYSAPRYDGSYCYHTPPANLEYPRYQQYNMHLERKY